MSDRADITIIGAGIIGLAVAARVAGKGDVYLLERNEAFGKETSSRHSGVIHSGIYYPRDSMKSRMCVTGNLMLYELCNKYGIGYKKLGKLIVAESNDQLKELEMLLERGRANGASGLEILSRREIKRLEPNVEGVAAIYSPSTGIIDSYELMRFLMNRAKDGGAQIAYKTTAVGIEKLSSGYEVVVQNDKEQFSFTTSVLINCAGLSCDRVAELAGIDIIRSGYKLHYCKGEYFSVGNNKSVLVKALIFPIPPPEYTGVGIHVTFDMDGRMLLGPSIQYVDSIDYAVDDRHRQLFYDSVRNFLPFIQYDDLEPEMAGIRPKLQQQGEDVKDFVIRDESDKGLPGFINLIGIESPGLTSSLAIAEYVENMVRDILAN